MIDGMKPPKQQAEPRQTKSKIKLEDSVDEPAFKTPEEIAKTDEVTKETSEEVNTPSFANSAETGSGFNPIAWFAGLGKKQKLLFAGIALLVIAGIGGGAWALFHKPAPKPASAPAEVKKEEPPKPIYSPLTGIAVTKEQSELPVTAIMIENSPDARPQSGLNQAGV